MRWAERIRVLPWIGVGLCVFLCVSTLTYGYVQLDLRAGLEWPALVIVIFYGFAIRLMLTQGAALSEGCLFQSGRAFWVELWLRWAVVMGLLVFIAVEHVRGLDAVRLIMQENPSVPLAYPEFTRFVVFPLVVTPAVFLIMIWLRPRGSRRQDDRAASIPAD